MVVLFPCQACAQQTLEFWCVYLPRSHCTLTRLRQKSASFCQLKATFHYAIQLPTSSRTGLRPNSITLSSSLAGRRPAGKTAREHLFRLTNSPAGLRPASELDSVIKLVTSSSQTSWWTPRASSRGTPGRKPGRRQVRAISTCRNSSNLSATGLRPGLRPG